MPDLVRRRSAVAIPRLRTLVSVSVALLLLTLVAGISVHAVLDARRAQPSGVPGSWRLRFADDFSGRELDTTKWSTGWFGSSVTGPVNSSQPACYDPAQVQLRGDDALSLELIAKEQWCGGRARAWTTGLVSTNGRYSYAYGASEARLNLPTDATGRPVNWPAFWATGQNWPHDGENDVVEAMDGSVGPHFHSPQGAPGFEVPGSWGGWHTFGSVWEPGKVSYFYDGRPVGSITQGVTSSPMYLVLGFDPAADGVTRPTTLVVDYVRVWQHD